MSTSSTNPSDIFPNTTWVAWGTGKVPVGIDTDDTDFNTVEKTGGAKSVTLTAAQSGQKNLGKITTATTSKSLKGAIQGASNIALNTTNGHIFDYASGICEMNRDAHSQVILTNSNVYAVQTTTNQSCRVININATHSHDITISGSNATSAHTNLQPYITCYMWKRTA